MRGRPRTPFAERFWLKVRIGELDQCWIWKAATDTHGYGLIGSANNPRTVMRAHRAAWMLTFGTEIPDGQFVLHRCDTPPCVNPAHLFLGTHAENMADMVAKGRAREMLTRPLSKSHRAITDRQGEVLAFIRAFIIDNGLSPTIRDVGRAFSITPRAAFDHVNALERKGYLIRYGVTRAARSLQLAPPCIPSTNHAVSTGNSQAVHRTK